MSSEVEHRFFEVNGIRLHAAQAGPPDGPLIILLHGFPEFWYGWQRQIGPLAAAGYRVLAPDQRGYNLSDKPRRLSGYRLDTLADDVVALIDQAGRDRVLLVGHDWGAAVGWWTAIRHPRRVSRLVVLNAPHPSVMRRHLKTNPTQRRRSWYFLFFQLPWLPERRFRRNDFEIGVRAVRGTARKGTFTDADMETYRRAWGQPGAVRGMIDWYRAALRRPPRRIGDRRVKPPTLIIWGERDRFLGREMVAPSLEYCEQGRVEMIPEATHWVQHEAPERVNRLLLEFFEEPA